MLPLLLYHYPESPYAEKVRQFLGLCEVPWVSIRVPPMPPRHGLELLVSGYRRIPVAQQGGDIFCDSQLICEEIAALGEGACSASIATPGHQALAGRAQSEVFFAALTAMPATRLLWALLRQWGLGGTLAFVKDRQTMMANTTLRVPQGQRARQIWHDYLDELERLLTGQATLHGDSLGYLDLVCYHPLTLHCQLAGRKAITAWPKVAAWFDGLAQRQWPPLEERETSMGLQEAQRAPRPLPESEDHPWLAQHVQIVPDDYARSPLSGRLVAKTSDRWIVAREIAGPAGPIRVHVHFPLRGYTVSLSPGA